MFVADTLSRAHAQSVSFTWARDDSVFVEHRMTVFYLSTGWKCFIWARDDSVLLQHGMEVFYLNTGWLGVTWARDDSVFLEHGMTVFYLNTGWKCFTWIQGDLVLLEHGMTVFYLSTGWQSFTWARDDSVLLEHGMTVFSLSTGSLAMIAAVKAWLHGRKHTRKPSSNVKAWCRAHPLLGNVSCSIFFLPNVDIEVLTASANPNSIVSQINL